MVPGKNELLIYRMIIGFFLFHLIFLNSTYTKENVDLTTNLRTNTGFSQNSISLSSQGSLFDGDAENAYTGPRKEVMKSLPKQIKPIGFICEKWVVTTTIFEPTALATQIGALSDWCFVASGDLKGPAEYIVPGLDSSRLVYLTPEDQRKLPFEVIKHLKWNHFGRKNVAFLYAILHGAKVIYDTDDDNILKYGDIPLHQFTDNSRKMYEVNQKSHLYNPYPDFNTVEEDNLESSVFTWPRGFPLDWIKNDVTRDPDFRYDVATSDVSNSRTVDMNDVAIIQSLADHDPDVDAIHRLTREIPFVFNAHHEAAVALPAGTASPFNSQATIFKYEAFWGLLLPVTVHGRVSDIWRSYFTQRMMWDIGKQVAFCAPFVVQCRNAHRYLADFDAEDDLYKKSGELVRVLNKWTPQSDNIMEMAEELMIFLFSHNFIGETDITLMRAFMRDLYAIGYNFPDMLPTQDRFESIPLSFDKVVDIDNKCEADTLEKVAQYASGKREKGMQ